MGTVTYPKRRLPPGDSGHLRVLPSPGLGVSDTPIVNSGDSRQARYPVEFEQDRDALDKVAGNSQVDCSTRGHPGRIRLPQDARRALHEVRDNSIDPRRVVGEYQVSDREREPRPPEPWTRAHNLQVTARAIVLGVTGPVVTLSIQAVKNQNSIPPTFFC